MSCGLMASGHPGLRSIVLSVSPVHNPKGIVDCGLRTDRPRLSTVHDGIVDHCGLPRFWQSKVTTSNSEVSDWKL
jgi:hypothetical protein